MIQLRFVSLDKWPGERTKHRQGSPFRSNYIKTLDLLEYELGQLRAKEIILQASVGWEDIRNDGWPKSNARFSDAGVILTFQSKVGPLSYPCDRYTDWQANVRAIALSLEALRAVDRYGVTKRAEQYQGWRQIAAPGGKTHFESADQAAIFIALAVGGENTASRLSSEILHNKEIRTRYYRQAAALWHPDAPTANVEQFHLLQEAMAILEAADKAKAAGG